MKCRESAFGNIGEFLQHGSVAAVATRGDLDLPFIPVVQVSKKIFRNRPSCTIQAQNVHVLWNYYDDSRGLGVHGQELDNLGP